MEKPPSNSIDAGDIQDLAVSVEQLTEEARLLRQSLDELRDDVVWAARQVLSAGEDVSPGYLPRHPVDPLAPDAFTANGAQSDAATRRTHSPPARNSAETVEYCCDCPRLAWNGDPDFPGVACENCGFVVAEHGGLLVCPNDDQPPSYSERDPQVADRQAHLFD